MKIVVSKNHDESSLKVALMISEIISSKENPVIGLATGSSVLNVYKELVNLYKEKKLSFKNTKSINLDEYIGLAPTHEQSYRYFMNDNLFSKVDIDIKNTFVPIGDNSDINKSLKDFQSQLNYNIRDFQLLGIGPNGHIAFNEPDKCLHANAHIVSIANSTIEANSRFFDSKDEVPKKAFTQGMGDILKAKSIALLATGDNKADAIKSLLFGDDVATYNPSTFLKMHANTTIFIDESLANIINYKV